MLRKEGTDTDEKRKEKLSRCEYRFCIHAGYFYYSVSCDLCRAGKITRDTALTYASNVDMLSKKLPR